MSVQSGTLLHVLLARARGAVKLPCISYRGFDFTLRPDGSVRVSSRGLVVGNISPDGQFDCIAGAGADWTLGAVSCLLCDPIGATRLEGQRSGVCCFCRARLTTAESVSVGYGPVCAAHWGLPWGTVVNPAQLGLFGEV